MFSNLEYLTGNAIVSYPFKDGCSPLSPDVFVDAQVYPSAVNAKRAYLSQFSKTGNSYSFSIAVTAGDNTVIDTITFTKVSPVVGEFFSYSGSKGTVKLILGTGITNLTDQSNTYTIDQSEFCSSAFILPPPLVTSLAFKKLNSSNVPVMVDTITTGDWNFAAGTNLQVTGTDSLQLGVFAGAGTGIYDGCTTIQGIYSINSIKPNQFGNFSLFTDGCYRTTPGTHSLAVEHTCNPKCTPDQLNAFAHYLNRVKDGMVTLVDHLNSVVTPAILAQMTKYKQMVDEFVPFIEIASSSSTVAGVTTNGYVLGVYNPYSSAINTNLVVTTPTGHTVVSGTIKQNSEGVILTKSSLGLSSENIPCGKTMLYEFITTTSTTTPAVITAKLTWSNSSNGKSGSAYVMQPVLNTGSQLQLKYVNFPDPANTANQKVKVVGYVINPAGGTADVTVTGSGAGLTYKANTFNMKVNNQLNTPAPDGPALTLNSVDLTKKVIFNMSFTGHAPTTLTLALVAGTTFTHTVTL